MAKKTDHSAKYETLRGYYEAGLWNEERLRKAVMKKWLTEAEYKELTGKQ